MAPFCLAGKTGRRPPAPIDPQKCRAAGLLANLNASDTSYGNAFAANAFAAACARKTRKTRPW
eukprot:7422565-Lingulodinium_polyedra.AAC.1